MVEVLNVAGVTLLASIDNTVIDVCISDRSSPMSAIDIISTPTDSMVSQFLVSVDSISRRAA
jgi:hypothetical protein